MGSEYQSFSNFVKKHGVELGILFLSLQLKMEELNNESIDT